MSAINHRETARKLLAAAMQVDPAEVPNDAALGQAGKWDSLAHMRLILSLEEDLGAQLTPEIVVGISSLEEIVMVLDSGGKRE